MTVSGVQFAYIIILTLSIVLPNKSQIIVNKYLRNDINNTANVIKLISEFSNFQIDEFLNLYILYNTTNNIKSVPQTECTKQLELFTQGIKNQELWSLKMLDASSKIPSGILNGNTLDLGMYDQCIAIDEVNNNVTLRGQHCMYVASFSFVPLANQSMKLTLSICLPNVCSPDEIKTFLQSIINLAANFIDNVIINVESVRCSSIDTKPWTTGGILTLILLGTLLSFYIICTISDIGIRTKTFGNTENSILKQLTKFSFYTNGQRILNMKVPKGNLPTITGLRFFSMAWIILGHDYVMPAMFGSVVNFVDVGTWIRSWNSVYIVVAPFAVDTFFVMSGFLTAYLFLREKRLGRTFNIFTYYLHRYIRLTPALAALLLLSIYIFPRIGSGALWQSSVDTQAKACELHWWKLILYIHNYLPKESMGCLGHTWYLAVDMQLFWLSPLILYPLARWPTAGFFSLIAFIVASVITPAVIAGINEYSGALFPTNLASMEDIMVNFYITSHTRAGPWLLGIFVGYQLFLAKENHVINCKISMWLGWLLTVLAFSFSFFTLRVFQNTDYKYNVYWEVFYAGLARHIWSFGVCWVIYASSVGYGGIICRLLSLPIFLPFSRISYCIYLVHFVVQMLKFSALRVVTYFSDLQMINLFLGDFVICIIGGFIFSICFESPFLALEKMIFSKNKPNNNSTNNNVNNYFECNGSKKTEEVTVINGIDNHGYKNDEPNNNNNNNSNENL